MVLMELAFLGSVIFGAEMIKGTIKEAVIESECGGGIENPSKYSIENKAILKERRKAIYFRTQIPYDKNGNPTRLDMQDLKDIEKYLKGKGYTEEEVNDFIDFTEKQHEIAKHDNLTELEEKHQIMLDEYYKNPTKREVFENQIYGTNYKIDERMKRLMNNKLWRAMVQHYTHDGLDVEYWTLEIPVDMSTLKLQKLYREVCKTEGVYNGF